VLDLQNPKARKTMGWALAGVVVLGVAGVLAGDQIVQLLTALFVAAFGA
jgi:hypothetical protein